MAKFLLDALSSLAAAEDSKHTSGGDNDSQAISLERATLVKIRTSLGSPPTVVSPERAVRRKNSFSNTVQLTMPLSSTINLDASVDTMTTSFDTLMSPPRRTRHGRVAASAVVVTSPRGDHDSQRVCIIRPPAVTGCTGRGRYLIDEFVQFSVGDQLIVVIPADHRSDLNYEAHHQHQFCERVVATGRSLAE